MPIATTCPECSGIVSFSVQAGGRKSPCPKCRKLIMVPQESTVDAPPSAAPTGKTSFTPRSTGKVEFATNRQGVSLPVYCACCMGEATEQVAVRWERHTQVLGGTRVESLDIPFPYCKTCAAHVRWYERSWTAALIMGFVGFFGMMFLIPMQTMSKDDRTWGLVGMFVGGVAIMFLTRLFCKLIQPGCRPGCSTATKAVHCGPGGCNQFHYTFTNREFARRFIEMNE